MRIDEATWARVQAQRHPRRRELAPGAFRALPHFERNADGVFGIDLSGCHRFQQAGRASDSPGGWHVGEPPRR
jgi:hypothetical protein